MRILVLKKWIYPQLRDAGMKHFCNPADVAKLVALQDTLDAISSRPCRLTWCDFVLGDAADILEEVEEAKQRPSVVQRWTDVASGLVETHDKNGKL